MLEASAAPLAAPPEFLSSATPGTGRHSDSARVPFHHLLALQAILADISSPPELPPDAGPNALSRPLLQPLPREGDSSLLSPSFAFCPSDLEGEDPLRTPPVQLRSEAPPAPAEIESVGPAATTPLPDPRGLRPPSEDLPIEIRDNATGPAAVPIPEAEAGEVPAEPQDFPRLSLPRTQRKHDIASQENRPRLPWPPQGPDLALQAPLSVPLPEAPASPPSLGKGQTGDPGDLARPFPSPPASVPAESLVAAPPRPAPDAAESRLPPRPVAAPAAESPQAPAPPAPGPGQLVENLAPAAPQTDYQQPTPPAAETRDTPTTQQAPILAAASASEGHSRRDSARPAAEVAAPPAGAGSVEVPRTPPREPTLGLNDQQEPASQSPFANQAQTPGEAVAPEPAFEIQASPPAALSAKATDPEAPAKPEPAQPSLTAIPRDPLPLRVEVAPTTHAPSASRERPVEAMHIIGEIAEKAALELRQGHTEVRLELDPPDLGRVLVRLTSERGVVAARLEVTLPAVKDLLQENLGNLRTALEKAQVGIGDCTVSLGTARQHQEFAPSDHRRQAPAPLSRPLPLASQSPLPSARIFAASPAPSAAALDYLA